MLKTTNLLTLALLLAFSPNAMAWPAKVLEAPTGDVVKVAPCNDESAPVLVNLYGIDAPELKQEYGDESRGRLEYLAQGKEVEIVPMTVSKKGRIAALVFENNNNLNVFMLKDGGAWLQGKACKQSFCKSWKKLQEEARNKAKGLWAGNQPIAPWKWRKIHAPNKKAAKDKQ